MKIYTNHLKTYTTYIKSHVDNIKTYRTHAQTYYFNENSCNFEKNNIESEAAVEWLDCSVNIGDKGAVEFELIALEKDWVEVRVGILVRVRGRV